MAFMGGSTGVIYRQFSVTIIAAMMLSVLVALILTPVLCASLLKPVPKGHQPAEGGVWFLRPFFRWFDRVFFCGRELYLAQVGRALTPYHSLSGHLRADRGGLRVPVPPDAHGLSAGRGPRHDDGPGHPARQLHDGHDPAGHGAGPGPFSQSIRRTRWNRAW